MIERVGVGVLVILTLATFFAFLGNIFLGLPINGGFFAVVLLIFFFLFWFLFLRKNLNFIGKEQIRIWLASLRPIEWVLLLIIVANFGLNLLMNWYWPPHEFDALAMYDYRGRVFAKEARITGISDGYEVSYPLFTSLLHTMLYTWGFENPKIIYSLIFIVFVLVFISIVKRHTNRLPSLFAGALLATTPLLSQQAQIAYTNMSFAAYLGLAMVFLASFLSTARRKDALYSILLLGASAWIRAATLPFVAFFLLVFFLLGFRDRFAWKAIPLLVGWYLFFEAPWRFFQAHILGIPGYELRGILAFFKEGNLTLLGLLPEVLRVLNSNLLSFGIIGGVGILFLATVFFSFIHLFFNKREQRPFLFSLAITVVGILIWIFLAISIFPFSDDYRLWKLLLTDSMSRFFLVFYPIILFTVFVSKPIQALFKELERVDL